MGMRAQLDADLAMLRTLCDESVPLDERRQLLRSLAQHVCVEPEHQLVLESVRALLPRGPLSAARLAVHLNNRGFPDTDVEKYFQPPAARQVRAGPSDEPAS